VIITKTSRTPSRGNQTKSAATKTTKACEPSEAADLPAGCSQKNSGQLTSTPGAVMSISSSSSASCGYKDFLIDDDYVDQPQLLLSRNDDKNVKDLDETLVEKLDTYLADSKEGNEVEADKSEDDCSVREILQQSEMEEKSADATYGTLSDQESINSEADCIFNNQQDPNFQLMNQNDILQDVLDMNTLLSKLKTILLESDNFNVNSNFFTEDGEKVEHSEKEIVRENLELKNNILLLRSQLEEKEEIIRNLENKLQSKTLPTCTVQTQTSE